MSLGVLLCSAEKVKQFTNVNENLDEQLLLPNIQIAQEIGLQTLLGTKFYNHILSAAETSTLTADETNLVENYISPYLLWQATYEALPEIWMRMMNKSLSIGESPNARSADRGDMTYLRNIHQQRSEFYAQRMQDFLSYRQGQFPLYFQYNASDGMPKASVNYYSGIHIPNGPRRGGWRYWSLGLPVYTDPTNPNNCCW